MSDPDRERLRERLHQAERDLEEVDAQLDAGELDSDTAAWLRERYLAEAAEARARLSELEDADTSSPTASRSSSPRRTRGVVGAVLLGVAAIVVMITFNAFAQPDEDAGLQGVAAGTDAFDPSQYSNETMEAVIASYANDPAVADQLPYMRFALAERYFEEGDYQKAFSHYETILKGDPPPDLYVQSMTRLAWIVWVGNGETDLAIDLLDRALEVRPDWPETLYVKAQVVWCGTGDAAAAVDLLDRVLQSSELDDATRQQVESDRAVAVEGGACR